MYEYKAKVIDVYDGDTCTIVLDLGLNISKKEKVRLYGIDTPELRSKSIVEKDYAKMARDYLRELILGKEVTVRTHKTGKYGRYLVDIYLDSTHINNLLIQKRLAREYFGGKKEPWNAIFSKIEKQVEDTL